MQASPPIDIAIVGGGLAGSLIALALAERRPELRVALIEGAERIGGNHIWSFFDGDVAAVDRWLVEPLVAQRWEGHEVRFPAHTRVLKADYNSATSELLDRHVRARLGDAIVSGVPVASVTPTSVTLADQRTIGAKGVIDARGPGDLGLLDLGWQKFLGLELILEEPHGVARPVIMDATVDQADGYRFVYLLPFGPDRLFVEDTYYSDTPDLDVAALKDRIRAYAAAKGWRITRVERRETGVLPVAIGGDFDAYWRSSGEGIAKAGVRAGLFHPTTGYSLPDAVRTAMLVAGLGDISGEALHRVLRDHAAARWRERGFYRLLDTMLFRAAGPAERYRVLERFYTLNEGLVGRFYAGQSTLFDKARVLIGKPPVPISRAVRAILEARR